MDLSGLPEKANKKEVFVIDLVKERLEVIPGKPEEAFSQAFKASLESLRFGDGPCELHDWGGVISNATDDNRSKLCPSNTTAYVYSFTPWNAKGKGELPKMVDFAKNAGFAGMIIMTTTAWECGKVDVFSHMRTLKPGVSITYYEDTYGVIKDCVGANTTCYHVPSPEFPVEDADKVAGVVDGSISGYLERWEPTSNGSASVKATLSTVKQSGSASVKGTPSNLQKQQSVDLHGLDKYLAHHSYLGSEAHVTEVDYDNLSALQGSDVNPDVYPHLHRWMSHITSLQTKFGNFDSKGQPLPKGAPR